MIQMASNAALDITIAVAEQHRDIELAVSKRRKYMSLAIEKSTTPYPEYEGPYNVEQTLYYGSILETKGKGMLDDVTVNPIRIYEVSNPAGGKTVTIGAV